jgi:hypothetical protein
LTTLVEGNILAFNRYKTILEDRKVKAKDQSGDENPLTLSHALWMCNYSLDYFKKNPNTYPLDKFSRWLGFVQAILVLHKVTTVEDERNITRPWFTKGTTT